METGEIILLVSLVVAVFFTFRPGVIEMRRRWHEPEYRKELVQTTKGAILGLALVNGGAFLIFGFGSLFLVLLVGVIILAVLKLVFLLTRKHR